MNFTYFKFLFITTIKKRPIWITWALYLLTAISFLIILPAVARMNTLQVWANTTMAVCQTFLGMTVAIYTAILAIHIFKDGVEEGTELVVISKPISRRKIVFTKFVLFAAFCLMVNLTSIIITIFTILLPTTEMRFYWGLIVSMLIGNLVCFGVFGSISILTSINFAKVGVIITNIIISLIFLIYQCLTLFVFEVPIKSLSNHNVTAPSYIISNRDTTTGKYKEEEVVCFNTNVGRQIAGLPESEWNKSTNWKEAKDYWLNTICGKDPTLILNITDFAGQVSLSYLSAGIDEYAYRQGHRFFAISRFYNYDLTSPASPEIISGVENKKTLPWIYNEMSKETYKDEESGFKFDYWYPTSFGFAGIAPLGTTRLRGYGDQLPVGFYVRSGEILSSKDLYFEPDQWVKFSKPFDQIYDRLFNFENYQEYASYEVLTDPIWWLSAWCTNNACLNRYYTLLWSCFTGRAGQEEYFNDPEFLKEYSKDYFEINSVNDLNERLLQFKCYVYYKVLKEQLDLLNSETTNVYELEAKNNVLQSYGYQFLDELLSVKHMPNSWMMQYSGNEGLLPPYIEPGTQAPDIDLMNKTCDELVNVLEYHGVPQEQRDQIISNSVFAKLRRTMNIFNNCCNANEEFLFNSLDKPERSAQYHGKSYMVTGEWYSYWDSLLSPVGQNMNWFYYTSHETIKFWIYAVIWGTISLSLFAAGVVLYNKYDVK